MSEEAERNGADVDLKIGGQEVRLKNIKSLNTLATVATLIILCTAAAYGYTHIQDSREVAVAMRDMAQAIREGNCINSYPEHVRESRVEHCKRMVR